MHTPVPPPAGKLLVGRGRSAFVLLRRDPAGSPTVEKVFDGDGPSRLVHEIVFGAPNPYEWCEAAVQTAWLRRLVLSRLVPLWFEGRVRLPETFGYGWDDARRRYALHVEWIRGRHLPLRGPLRAPEQDRLPGFLAEVVRPLARHLEASGFVGLVWQAGRGNPVAVGNFLLEDPTDEDDRWVWIDLESGVPALFSPSPAAWWSFYGPWTLRLRRPLFDDVDVPRLRAYLARGGPELRARAEGTPPLDDLVDRLEEAQRRWKGLRRLDRALLAEIAAGRLPRARAKRLRRHPFGAPVWLFGRALRALGRVSVHAGAAALRAFARIDLLGTCRSVLRFLTSQRYRADLARGYLRRRVDRWHERGFFDEGERRRLLEDLEKDETSEYVTDFGVHLLVKPFVKFVQWVVLPLLLLLGVAQEAAVILLILGGGAIVRTLYTSVRFFQALLRRQRLPWVALGVGALPWVGNAAWPAELIVSSVGESRVLARFLLQDVFATLGRRIPVWGGRDTLTEHLLSRVPDRLWRRSSRSPSRAVAAPTGAPTGARTE